ncbi:D-alanyl-D-alanine carboxypeptidase [Desulfuribacillus stibiiarsenatis]|uniref:serine-type D-Ala-D-Ala carboxypeptidase n=1 Tax=Desulfuribacillus stibiiarsenatis TaxID=1390249 RepID=A0A1E5L6D2_9FIRM|nr:D-alanyl-D-alanine carboxypeptidase family protein [Desulfuribacillus stibiiarsenatis]OEH85700.1 D-alanyl-D-alanine carboxypeptidase [Desulfuribacillus stibiiarsenatis]
MRKYTKIIVANLLCFILIVSNLTVVSAEANKTEGALAELASNAKSAVLMDSYTGQIMFEKNSHQKLPPASITKVMSILLIMEALEQQALSLTDVVTASENASAMGGSQIFLATNEQMTVEEMLRGITIASGNDATVAMAEHLAGTEAEFVKMMNQKAKELGMKNTNFMNSHGLPHESHYTTAFDIAIMSRELLRKYPQITMYTSIYSDYLRKDTDRPLWLVNTNRLVKFYEGADGLKTGYTSEAKYCLSATAKKDNLRVIAVVMGEPTSKMRSQEVSEMFNYAFSKYKSEPIIKKGEFVSELFVNKGQSNRVNIVAEDDLLLLLKKSENTSTFTKEIFVPEHINAPVKKGEPIGYIAIQNGDKEMARISLVAETDIEKASFMKMSMRSIGYWFKPSAKLLGNKAEIGETQLEENEKQQTEPSANK